MESLLERFKAHDWNTGAWFPQAPRATVASLQENLSTLDTEARLLAVMYLTDTNSAEAAEVLLRMSGDADGQVAAMAAQGLNSTAGLPSLEAIAAAIPQRRHPMVRSQLYRAIARSGDIEALTRVRSLMLHEGDDEVRLQAVVSAILLGGQEERDEFTYRLRAARPANALEMSEKLLSIGDWRLARGLLPWLNNLRPVTRIGSDADQRMLRMCDLAVLTAHRLGIRFPVNTESPTNFDADTIVAARNALEAIDE